MTCPTSHPYTSSWTLAPDGHGDCWANFAMINSTSLEGISNLGYVSLSGFAKCSNCGTNDEALLCDQYNCWSVVEPDSVLSLASHWIDSEWNIFGYEDYSQAQFNSGASLTVDVSLSIASGGAFSSSCLSGSYTGESNNLNAGTCHTSYGSYYFTES